MKLVPVDELPFSIRRGENVENKNLQAYLYRFYDADIKYARLEYDALEYTDDHSACNSIRLAVKHCGLPIKVKVIDYVPYLIRTDI